MKKHLTFPPSIRSSISLQIRCRLDVGRNFPPSELAYSSIFIVKGTKAVFPAHNLAPPLKNGSEPVEPDLSGASPTYTVAVVALDGQRKGERLRR